MKITLKHILLTSIALFGALMFILGLVVPETITFTFKNEGVLGWSLPSSTFKGSILEISNVTKEGFVKAALLGDYQSLGLFGAVYYDIFVSAFLGQTSVSSGIYEVAYALAAVYQVLAVIGLVIAIICVLAAIGAFFIPSMKGARALTIPFFAFLFIWSIVAMVVIAMPGTMATALNSSETWSKLMQVTIERSAPGLVLIGISMVSFIAMLIVPGVVPEKVLVGKKN